MAYFPILKKPSKLWHNKVEESAGPNDSRLFFYYIALKSLKMCIEEISTL